MGQQRIDAKAAPAALLAACALLALAVLAAQLATASTAQAAPLPQLWTACFSEEGGSGANECDGPGGIAVDPNIPGHVYVADSSNSRINEFNAWGAFVKSWGWGVADGSFEPQTCGPGATPPSASCQKGIAGPHGGQLGAGAVAVDSAGDVYVIDANNHRIQKFGPEGGFLRAWGGDVVAHGPGDSSNNEVQELTLAAGEGTFALTYNGYAGFGGESGGRGHLTEGSATVANVTTFTTADFEVGQTVTGDGVPPGTRITAVGAGTLTLSAAATETKTDVVLRGSWTTGTVPYNASAAEVKEALDELATIGGVGGSVSVSGGPGDPTGSSPYIVTFEGNLGGDQVPQLELDRDELGGDAIGATLRCASDADAPTIEFSWLRNGEPISGAESPTYTSVAADEGSAMQCRVRTEVAGGGGAVQAATPVYLAPPAPATAPPVAGAVSLSQSGSLKVGGAGGATLTCKPGTWQNVSTFAYEWYRNGAKIVGAEASSYVVSAKDLATPALFQCAAIGSNAGGTATLKLSLDALTGPPGGSSNSGLTSPLPAFPVYELNPRESMEPPSNVLTTNHGGAAEVCAAAAGDVCKAGIEGDGAATFGGSSNRIAIDLSGTLETASDDVVYVGGADRIQSFDGDGSHTGEIPFSGAPAPEPGEVHSLAVDQASGDLYFSYVSDVSVVTGEAERPDVYRFEPSTNEVTDTLEVAIPRSIATAPDGSVYVFDGEAPGDHHFTPGNHIKRVLKFDAAGDLVEVAVQNSGPTQFDSDQFTSGSFVNLATGSACFAGAGHDLYATNSGGTPNVHAEFARAWGLPPDDLIGCPRPEVPPSILDQYAVFVDDDTATVRAKIDPRFWEDTIFYVQYATAACVDAEGWGGGCVQEQPADPTPLSSGIVSGGIETPDVVLSGLLPDTEYRYRFVAESGLELEDTNGPVFGEGGTLGADGEANRFRTFQDEQIETGCDNQRLREGAPSALLPECRAYEQVTPVDKNGFGVIPAPVIASRDGEAVSFASLGAFAGAPVGAFPNGYGAVRTDAIGWPIHPMSAPLDPHCATAYTGSLYGASEDTKRQLVGTNAALHPNAQAGEFNLYVHDSTTGAYELIAEVLGIELCGVAFDLVKQIEFAGASTDGSRIYFDSPGGVHRLKTCTPSPVAGTDTDLYEFSGGECSLVGVFPNGKVARGSRVGSPSAGGAPAGRAVSVDGERVYWQGDADLDGNLDDLYLRDGNQSKLVADGADFEYASADGGLAFLTKGSDLYRYDAGSGGLTDLTPTESEAGVGQVLGASEDGSYAYFVAGGELALGASEGENNLYAWHEGDGIRLIGRLDPQGGDVREARLSPSGRYLGFRFGGEIEGPHPHRGWPENAQTKLPFTQAYLYDHAADTLACASCPPADGPNDGTLHGEARFHGPELGSGEFFVFAGDEGLSRNVSDRGELFFHTPSRLVRRDNNGEAACPLVDLRLELLAPTENNESEQPACTDAYVYRDGELRLISAADDSGPAFFGDASADGRDVMIVTAAQLVGQDEDAQFDLYDARVEGGIAVQNVPDPMYCAGEECRGQGSEKPADAGPATPYVQPEPGVSPPSPDCDHFSRQARRKLAAAKKAARHAQTRRARKLREQANKLRGARMRCNRRAAR